MRLLREMRIFPFIAFGLTFLLGQPGLPAAEEKEDQLSLGVTLNSDTFFGFYPTFQGNYALSDAADFTFYGILWSGGEGDAWGNWTEAGLGVNFKVIEGLAINPQIGVLGGNLLSSGTKGESVLGDGYVPNLTINLDRNGWQGQGYVGYYSDWRDKAPPDGTTLRYVHYWVNLGYKFTDFVSSGAHWESLINTGGSNVDSASDVYRWVGPYIQFAKRDSSVFARFTGGPDLRSGRDSFFKVTTGFTF